MFLKHRTSSSKPTGGSYISFLKVNIQIGNNHEMRIFKVACHAGGRDENKADFLNHTHRPCGQPLS